MDLIDRQAAIDALGERPIVWIDDDEYSLGQRNQYDCDKLAIETVPSAQPIIRCKDCKWHKGQYHCANTDTYGFDNNDFCSAAERREEGGE